MRQVKKRCTPTPILLAKKIQKNLQRFPKSPGNQNKRSTVAAKPKVTTTTKHNDRRINDRIPQKKLSCIKVGTTTNLRFQQDIIQILRRDI